MRMPSTKMIGSLLCEIDALPRMRMRAPSPVMPLDGSPTTPGSRPCSASVAVRIGACSGGFTTAMVLPSFFVSTAPPAPVTTTWSSWSADWRSSTVRRTDCPAATVTGRVTGWNPTSRTRTSTPRAGTPVMRYTPAVLVTAPSAVPTTLTCAFSSPRPPDTSVTRPSMMPVACAGWARTAAGATTAAPAGSAASARGSRWVRAKQARARRERAGADGQIMDSRGVHADSKPRRGVGRRGGTGAGAPAEGGTGRAGRARPRGRVRCPGN
jgi:hypothetical protein